MWQESPDEGWFCLACARCDLNNLFFGLKGCDIATYCEENMHLALTGCEPSRLRPAKLAELASFKFLFDEVEDGLDGDQIQVHGTNLCIQQVLPGGTGSVELRQCDSFESLDTKSKICDSRMLFIVLNQWGVLPFITYVSYRGTCFYIALVFLKRSIGRLLGMPAIL